MEINLFSEHNKKYGKCDYILYLQAFYLIYEMN
jgi:hypothetical protein